MKKKFAEAIASHSRRMTMVERMLAPGDREAIIAVVIKKAEAGDKAATRLVARHGLDRE